MDVDLEMISWNAHWALVEGLVLCPRCRRGQPLSDADAPFQHEPECKAGTSEDQKPWADLHNLMDRWRG